MKVPAFAVVLLALMSLASGFTDLRMRAYPTRAYTELVPRVVDATADAPERYRVLVPFAVSRLSRWSGLSLAATWHTSRLALFFAAYLVTFVYLRTWFVPESALFGTALVAATLPLTFTNSWAHPDHIMELALFTAGCLAVARDRVGWLALVIAIATLNRETTVFLVPLYFVAGQITRRRVVLSALFGVEWAAIYVGLRAWRGFVAYDYFQIGRNLEFLKLLPANYDPYYRAYAYFALALFGGLLAAVALGPRRERPLFASRALWVVPMFVAVAFVISSIVETRIFTPLYPLVLPAVMFTCGTAETLITAKPLKSHA